jgi:hypothetical protein
LEKEENDMKKILVLVLSLIGIGFLTFLTPSTAEAGTLQPGSNNVITSGRGVTSKMVNGKLYNQYKIKSGSGHVDLMVITHFSRTTGTGAVTVSKVEVKYTNTSNGTPYFSSIFLDKRDGSKVTYPTIPKDHKILKQGTHSFTVTTNSKNVQSVNVYLHADLVGSAAKNGTRYQYVTMFY